MSSCWQLDFSPTPPPAVRTRSGSRSLAAETFANEVPSVCLLEVLPARPVITLHTIGVRQRQEVLILQHIKRQHPGQPGPSPVGNQSQQTRGGAPLPSPLKTTTMRTSQCSGTFPLSSHCCLPPWWKLWSSSLCCLVLLFPNKTHPGQNSSQNFCPLLGKHRSTAGLRAQPRLVYAVRHWEQRQERTKRESQGGHHHHGSDYKQRDISLSIYQKLAFWGVARNRNKDKRRLPRKKQDISGRFHEKIISWKRSAMVITTENISTPKGCWESTHQGHRLLPSYRPGRDSAACGTVIPTVYIWSTWQKDCNYNLFTKC